MSCGPILAWGAAPTGGLFHGSTFLSHHCPLLRCYSQPFEILGQRSDTRPWSPRGHPPPLTGLLKAPSLGLKGEENQPTLSNSLPGKPSLLSNSSIHVAFRITLTYTLGEALYILASSYPAMSSGICCHQVPMLQPQNMVAHVLNLPHHSYLCTFASAVPSSWKVLP